MTEQAPTQLDIRIATQEDIDDLVRSRIAFSDEWHPHTDEQRAAFDAQLRAYLPSRIASQEFVGILGYVGADLATAVFLVTQELPATCRLPRGRSGTLLNVYTFPAHRRKGYGKQVLQVTLD